VVLPGSNAENAVSLARRITDRLTNDKEEPPLSFSFGVAGYPEHGKSLNELLAIADGALYEMKKRGPHPAPTR
jgi:diguanylate cyclase (GGDEF)-like protein